MTTGSFHSHGFLSQKLFNIGLCNARSICNKLHDVLELVIQEDIDILCVTETWLKLDDKVIFREIHELGFSIISQPRMGRGGGIAFIFKLGLP